MTLEIKNITKVYRGVEAATFSVLSDISFTLAAGENMAITGPSGSGKTTLLNIIGTLDRPDSGSVFFEKTELTALEERQQAYFRNRTLGFIFQTHYLLPQCSIIENCLIPTLAQSNKKIGSQRQEQARRLLEQVGLGDRMDAFPGELSVGQQQRAAVVRALVHQPRLVLADEPTGSLDQENAAALMDLLLDLQRRQGFSLIVVTHAAAVAARMSRHWRLQNHTLTPAEKQQ